MSKNVIISTFTMNSFNGVSRWNELAALTLVELGHDVTLVTNTLDEEFVKPNLKESVKIVDSGFKYNHPKCLPRLNIIIFQIYTTLWYLLAGPRGDVFLTDSVYSIFLVRLFTSQKCLLYIHYPDSLYTREVPNISLKKLFYTYACDVFEIISVLSAHHILCNSKYSMNHFQSSLWYFKTSKMSVLYPYVYENIANVKNEKWNGTGENFTFITINRFDPFKKFDVLIDAFHKVCTSPLLSPKINLKLVIAGGKASPRHQEFDRKVKKMIVDLNLTEMVTILNDISYESKHDLLQNSHSFVYSTYNEHFGIGICEAMEYNLPVVGVALGGPLEIIDHGKNGLLCKPNSLSMSEQMLNLVLNRNGCYERIESNCKANLAEKFGTKIFGENFNLLCN